MQGYILFADGELIQQGQPGDAGQTVAAAETQAPAGDGGQQAPAQRQQTSAWPQFAMPLLLILLFYFVFLKPQQRKEKERRRMIEALRVGAKVVFAGGMIGEIVEAREKTFVIETEGSARMEVLRSAVQELVQ